MTGPDPEESVERVIAEYLAAEDAGAMPDRAAILAAHPDLADDLQSFFRENDRFDRLAAPLRDDPAQTVDLASADSAPDGRPSLKPGKQVRYFGDYEILEELGRGGMGVVYRARQVSLNRPVALKMIRSGILADAEDLRRFQNEVEAVALLDHPGVVPVYEVGELEGQRYFSMKMIEGGCITPRIQTFRDDPRAAALLVAEAAEALAHAHARGVLHRDLKPANLLIDSDGHPHVTDFGLAKRIADDSEMTRTGAILGTPAYMSPEQAAGRNGAITTATDVYGLGAVLYSLLTGRAPFAGTDVVETLDAVRTSSPEGPRRLNPRVPRDLETVCLKCLEKEPGRRYATAQALADDLRAWLGNRPIAARPAGLLERAALFARRKPAAAAAYGLAAAVVFLIGFGGSIAWLWRAAERARADAETARVAAEAARGQAESARAGLAAVEYGRTIEAAHQAWREDSVVAAEALLDGTRPDLRGWEWRYVRSLCHPELATLDDTKSAFVAASFDAGGSRLATLSARHRLQYWDAGTGTEVPARQGRTFEGLDFLSLDGARIVLPDVRSPTAKIRDVDSGAELAILKGHSSPISSAAFSRDGTRVVTSSFDGNAKVWDSATGADLLTLRKPMRSADFQAAFSPDGSKVATAGEDGLARIWDGKTGKEIRALRGHAGSLNGLGFSKDGTRIVTAGDDKTARIWDAESGACLLTLRGHTRRVLSASFSRDGRSVVTASADRTARIWDARDGAESLTLNGHATDVWSARFSPDGSRVVTVTGNGSYSVRVWDAVTGPECLTLSQGGSVRASFSPDGSRVATAQWSGRSPASKLWDARAGRERLALKGGAASSASFNADGSRLVTAGGDRTARVYDAQSGAEALVLKGHADFLTSASFSPDGRQIVTSSADGTAKIWDARDGKELLTLTGHAYRCNSAAFNRDGSRVVTSSGDGAVFVWDAGEGTRLLALKAHARFAEAAVFCPDGSRILTGGGNLAKVWDARTGAGILTLAGHTGTVRSAVFSPDGSRIVTASGDGTARLWDAANGTEVLALKGHSDSVGSAAWLCPKTVSPQRYTSDAFGLCRSDPKPLCSGEKRHGAGLEDPSEVSHCRSQVLGQFGTEPAAFSPDGSRIATGSDDGTIRIWDARPYAVVRAERTDSPSTRDPAPPRSGGP